LSGCAVSHSRTIGEPFYLVVLGAGPTVFHVDQRATINFTTLVALLHLADAEDLKDNVYMGGVLQAPLGVTSDIF
jgi:hypothetical protein